MSVTSGALGASTAVRDGIDRTRWHTDVLLLLMALLWGLNFSVLKYTTGFIGALAINGLRIPGAAIAQLGVARILRTTPPTRRETWELIVLGMLGNGVYQTLFIMGLVRSRVATAALLIASTPAFVAILGRLMRTEHLTPRQWLGVAMQISGCAIVAFGAVSASTGEDTVAGVVLIMLAALSWAVYAVRIKRYSDHIEPWHLGGYTMLGGAIVAVTVGVPAISRIEWHTLPTMVYAALAYSSLIAMVVAYLFYYRGLKVLGPTRTSMYSNLQPIIAMAVAWLLLRERPTSAQLLGAALIISGLLTARSAADPAEA